MSTPSIIELQNRFLLMLPRIVTHAKIFFRQVPCRTKREEFVAETVALAWQWHLRMAAQGKDARQFVSVLATFAARAAKSGRKLAGMNKAKDAMNERTQMKRGFVVGKLPDFSTLNTNPLAEALIDNTRTPIPDAIQFKLDFPAWRRTRSRRDRKIIYDMMLGHGTNHLARKHGLSASRISQMRNELKVDYEKYTEGELAASA
ncbi:MAG: hypothetical protein JNM56_09135 [Planctomycetia bacterium]|nr:hypothetical protein [Planctomycetia bacterium]